MSDIKERVDKAIERIGRLTPQEFLIEFEAHCTVAQLIQEEFPDERKQPK